MRRIEITIPLYVLGMFFIVLGAVIYSVQHDISTAQGEDFVIRYYLAPIVDQFADNPDIDRQSYVSKVKLYLSDNEGHSSSVNPWPWENWALSEVNAALETHALIQADSEISLVPLWDDGGQYLTLNRQVNELSAASRTTIATFLENRGIPTGWIQGTHTIGRVFRYTTQILLTVKALKDDYPNVGLDASLSAIPSPQRARVLNWMKGVGITTNDITLSWSIRQLLQRIVDQYPWRTFMKFGGALL